MYVAHALSVSAFRLLSVAARLPNVWVADVAFKADWEDAVEWLLAVLKVAAIGLAVVFLSG